MSGIVEYCYVWFGEAKKLHGKPDFTIVFRSTLVYNPVISATMQILWMMR